jgi:ElaB/YqjD/DUF883 family membrane-anchored ribosome-binding protein
MKTLEQTLKELKQLEQLIDSSNGKFSEDQLENIVEQLSTAFESTQNELSKIENESKIQLENLENEK